MGTFSSQKKNTCSHLKGKIFAYKYLQDIASFNFFVVTHIDHYYIYALQVHAIKSGNSQSPNIQGMVCKKVVIQTNETFWYSCSM
jgi:hypothetical protein